MDGIRCRRSRIDLNRMCRCLYYDMEGRKLPLSVQGQMFYDTVSPDMGPDWSIRLLAQILLRE